MRKILHYWCLLALFMCCFLSLGLDARAAESEDQEEKPIAEDISSYDTLIDCQGIQSYFFFDGYHIGSAKSFDNVSFTLAHEKGIGSLYIIFQYGYNPYQVVNNDTGEEITVGQAGYLHDFVDLEALFGSAPSSVTVKMESGTVWINEVTVFSPGQVPDYVQKWEQPKDGETDLVLFSAHADDEHLYFAGILPYYGTELGYQVQVVYMTHHRRDYLERVHELLDGLWAVGIRSYPVLGDMPDFNLASLEGTYARYAGLGYSKDNIQEFVVEQMRRFKPKVVVTHDFKGEYRHGMHMVLADTVAKALEVSNDPEVYPEQVEQYGVWDVPKTYIHLYGENKIVMDWDQPLESFGGMTAFLVSRDLGFLTHKSQFQGFWHWVGVQDRAADIEFYSPCEYGLYRSIVGEDVEKNDFFENVTTYAQDRQAELERLAEEARLKAEEEARLAEEQRKEEQARQEAQARAEAERKAREEAEQRQREQEEAARLAAEAEAQKKQMTIIVVIVLGISIFAAITAVLMKKKFTQKSRKNF